MPLTHVELRHAHGRVGAGHRPAVAVELVHHEGCLGQELILIVLLGVEVSARHHEPDALVSERALEVVERHRGGVHHDRDLVIVVRRLETVGLASHDLCGHELGAEPQRRVGGQHSIELDVTVDQSEERTGFEVGMEGEFRIGERDLGLDIDVETREEALPRDQVTAGLSRARTPLLRYRTCDQARLAWQPDASGTLEPRLVDLEGRGSVVFRASTRPRPRPCRGTAQH